MNFKKINEILGIEDDGVEIIDDGNYVPFNSGRVMFGKLNPMSNPLVKEAHAITMKELTPDQVLPVALSRYFGATTARLPTAGVLAAPDVKNPSSAALIPNSAIFALKLSAEKPYLSFQACNLNMK